MLAKVIRKKRKNEAKGEMMAALKSKLVSNVTDQTSKIVAKNELIA